MEANIMKPDQTAPLGAVWSGSILFAIIGRRQESRWQKMWLAGIGIIYRRFCMKLSIRQWQMDQSHNGIVMTCWARNYISRNNIWAVTCDFQQCGILTSMDSDDPVQPPFKLRNSKWDLVSSLTVIDNSSDLQRLWSDCAYAQADLRLCWSHIPHCWKSHALAHIILALSNENLSSRFLKGIFSATDTERLESYKFESIILSK